MSLTPRKYIHNVTSIESSGDNTIGLTGDKFSKLIQNNIPIPSSFIITSKAFEDFLIANSSIDRILEIIQNFEINDMGSVEKASKTIANIIRKAEFPVFIKNEIVDAYRSLSVANEAYVNIFESPINSELQSTNWGEAKSYENVHGINEIIDKILNIWTDLFSTNALVWREQTNFSGELGVAVVVQKTTNAESSGIIRKGISNEEEGIIEIEAIYGVKSDDTTIIPDIYKVQINDLDVIEKNIHLQSHMYIRNYRNSRTPLKKINISQTWQSRQKLDNNSIANLARAFTKIAHMFGDNLELQWSKEADKIIITNILEFKEKKISIVTNLQNEVESLINNGNSEFKYKSSYINKTETNKPIEPKPFEIGIGNNKGTVTGKIRIVNDMSDLGLLDENTILLIKNSVDLSKFIFSELHIKGIVAQGEITSKTDLPLIHKLGEVADRFKENDSIMLNSDSGEVSLIENITEELTSVEKVIQKQSTVVSKVDTVEEIIKCAMDMFIDVNSMTDLNHNHENFDGVVTSIELMSSVSETITPKSVIVSIEFDKLNEKNFSEKLRLIHGERNQKNRRSIWLGVKGITQEDDLIDLKKVLLKERIRRTSTFKLFIFVDNLVQIFGIDDITSNDVDGIIIDTHTILKNIYGKVEDKLFGEKAFEKAMDTIFASAKKYRTKVLVLGDLPKDSIEKFIRKGISGFIFSGENLIEKRKTIAKNEIGALKSKRR